MKIKHYALCMLLSSIGAYAMENTPNHLYKIVSVKDWAESQTLGYIKPGSNDDKFIHLSKDDQYERIIKKYWDNQGYVLLKVDPKKFEGTLVLEENTPGGDKYYHLYNGKIPLSAVVY